MAEYDNKRTVGRNSRLHVAIQGVSNDPATSTLFPLGMVTTKSFAMNGNVLTANDSSNNSAFIENQMGTRELTLSVSGNYARNPADMPNELFINALQAHFMGLSADASLSQDPVILIKYIRPDKTLTAYMMINSISVEDPDAELSTFSMELSLAASPTYPPTWEDTV